MVLFLLAFPAGVVRADNLTSLGVSGENTTYWRLQNDGQTGQIVTLTKYGGDFSEAFRVAPGHLVVEGRGPGTYVATFDISGVRKTKASGPQAFDACFHLGRCEPQSACRVPVLSTIASVGKPVYLDPLEAIAGLELDELAVSWRWLDRPAVSVADFSDPAAVRPAFTADVPGTWRAAAEIRDAAVTDGVVLRTVEIVAGTEGVPPQSRVRAVGVPSIMDRLTLDGSDSFDPDGDALRYAWTVEKKPDGSAVTIEDTAEPFVDVAFDVVGDYVFGLTVTDTTGLVSSTSCVAATYQEGSEEGLRFRTSYDRNLSNDGGPRVVFDLGAVEDKTGDIVIPDFDVNGGGEQSFDTLRFVFGGRAYDLSKRRDFFNFVREIERDGDSLTDALISPDPSVADLTLRFGEAPALTVTLENVIGKDLQRQPLIARSVDFYEPRRGRQVAPNAALQFAERRALPTSTRVSPYASSDIDGDRLMGTLDLISAPGRVASSTVTRQDGTLDLLAPQDGEYIVRARISDGLTPSDTYQRLVVGEGPIAPVARIEASTSAAGQAFSFDGSQSYDFDGDTITWSWALIHRPAGSQADLAAFATPTTTLTPDVDGTYIVQLIVSDGVISSMPQTRAVVVGAPRPSVDAGPDLLRSGDGAVSPIAAASSETANFEWSVTGFVMGSEDAALSTPAAANPILTLSDAAAGAVLQVVATDGPLASRPDTVLVGYGNLPPQFSRARNIDAVGGEEITVAGTDYAVDPNGDAMRFQWSILSKPAGSATAFAEQLIEAETVAFIPDRIGTYLIQMQVDDGIWAADPIVISVLVSNSAPVAVASVPAQAFVGEILSLDATSSSDPDGNFLTYSWTNTSSPVGSTSVVIGGDAAVTAFQPDVPGLYTFELTVSDGIASNSVTSTLDVPNRAPVAALTGPSEAFVGDDVILDATGSSDPDGQGLTFSYEILSAPDGSTPTLVALDDGSSAGFSADRRGVYRIAVTVSDGTLESTAEISVSAGARNTAPILGELLAEYTVELGLKLSLDVSAFDAEGDTLTFTVTPLPLVENASFDAATGLLSFRPEAGQEGRYDLTVTVSDGRLTDTADVSVLVIPADAGETAVNGRLLDAVDFAAGIETPVVGVPVRIETAALDTVSDADGRFRFGGLTGRSDQVIVSPTGGASGYATVSRVVQITENQDRDIDPEILLVPLNQGCSPVVAGTPTILTSSVAGIRATLPADSVTDSSGAAYAGEVCLGTLPQLFQPTGMPDDVQACHTFALDAPGARFNAPVAVTANNVDGLAEGAALDVWRMGAGGTRFIPVSEGSVEAGGATVTASVVLADGGAMISLLPLRPTSIPSEDMVDGHNRTLTPFEGDLEQTYVLPGYRAFDEGQAVALAYHSTAADPTLIVAGDVTIDARASLPQTLMTQLDLAGVTVSDGRQWNPRDLASGSAPALLGERVTLRQPSTIDAQSITSGRYPYSFTTRAKYACSTVGASHDGELYIQNEVESTYGRGWSIAGLQKLVVDRQGRSLSIISDDAVAVFESEPTLTEFDPEPFVFPARGPGRLAIGDINGDDLPDVVWPDSGTGSVGLLRNLGRRGFEDVELLAVGDPNVVPNTGSWTPNLTAVEVIDRDMDGFNDLAFGFQLEDRFGYRNGLSGGGFASFDRAGVGDGTNFLDAIVVDLDSDGIEDVVRSHTAGGRFSLQRAIIVDWGNTARRIESTIIHQRSLFSGDGGAIQLEAGDLDGDGDIDLAFRTVRGIDLLANTGQRSFTLSDADLGGAFPNLFGEYLKLIDIDGNGSEEILYSTSSALSLFSASRVSLGSLPRPPQASSAMPISIADANGDGIPDIVASTGGAVHVYEGRGDGTFAPFETGLLPFGFGDLEVVDLDGDGSLDAVTTQRFQNTIFFSKPSLTGRLISGDGEFSTLTRLDDGTWERRYTDGTRVLFNAEGLQVAEVDQQGNRREFAYGLNGRLETVTDQVGGVTSFAYDALGRMASITDDAGRITTFEYDDQVDIPTMLGLTEPDGATVAFEYDDRGRLVSTTNQNGNETRYAFDATGRLSGATLPDGSSISMQIASSLGLASLDTPGTLRVVAPEDRITTVTDRRGEETQVEVNSFGAIVRMTDPLGRETRIARDDANLVTRVDRPSTGSPTGRLIDEMAYDARGNVVLRREAVGTTAVRTTRYEYEPVFSRLTEMTDSEGFGTTYEYDSFGELIRMVDAEGGITTMVLTEEGKLASRTDENGRTTSYTYDDDQNMTSMTYPDGTITRIEYDARGNMVTVIEAEGLPEERRVLRTFDDLNRMLTVEVTGPDGAQIDGITRYTYDAAGNVATITDETGLVTTMTYDALERLVTVDDPAEGLITRVYDEAGDVVRHIDGTGAEHDYVYDDIGRMIEVTDPEGFVKRFEYDLRDNILAVTDGRAGRTVFAYDPLDRMTGRTDPLGRTIARSYDGRDNLTVLTRENGQVETATYDGLSRRTQVVTPDNTLTYGYDPVGNLIAAADGDSRLTMAYDVRDRLVAMTTDGTVGPQPEITLTYTYDALSRRTSMSDSLGGTTTYAYDPESRLTNLTAPWGTAFSFGYDGEGRRTSFTSTSGRVSTMGYTNGLLSSLTHAQASVPVLDLDYGYAADGKLTTIIDELTPSASRRLSYDSLDRLVQVDRGSDVADGSGSGALLPVEDYAYDEEGNRFASHLSDLHVSNAHNQLTEDDDYTYFYDDRGNRVSRVSKADGVVESYGYDSQNRLVSYTDGVTTATYAYDALDRRIAKTVDGSVEAYVLDAWSLDPTASEVVMDFEGGTLARRWLHGPRVDEPLEVEDYAGTTAPGSGSLRALLANRLGSIAIAVSVATGAVASEVEYDSFGQRSYVTGTEADATRYGYTGREHDAESGLIYYRARHYDPALGQFLQQDPIGFAAGDLNLYAYVENDPFNATDPSGLSSSLQFGSMAGAAAAGGAAICAATDPCRSSVGGIFSGLMSLLGQINAAISQVPGHLEEWRTRQGESPPIGHNGGPEEPRWPVPYIPDISNDEEYLDISTANPDQWTEPQTLREQMAMETALNSPASGRVLLRMNNDPRFAASDGWQKMQLTVRGGNGSTATVHYQWNPGTGTVADIKIVGSVGGWP
ncbi:PKD domain-containing protein [Jannaschia pohangensis]|uniref:PKD domain-containing protein n=1 Tax=Jannaschia pohangensis TaxID=390807 RepID=UPI0015876405|nr:RHS repeat-associated core domain-containing protein [Jannaschia pohangensis]